ncbi:MAG: hypothetical protein H7240_03745 [Glaciimonas sp.]|nr:hypothetical protein [Glaciimonas sp.]
MSNYNVDANGYGSIGTEWRVGAPIEDNRGGLRFLMLTNHHVITDTNDIRQIEIWFDHEHNHCDEKITNSDTATRAPVKCGLQKLVRSNSTSHIEYQLFALQVNAVDIVKLKSFGYLGLEVTPTEGQERYIPQHGIDQNVKTSPERYLKIITVVADDDSACKIRSLKVILYLTLPMKSSGQLSLSLFKLLRRNRWWIMASPIKNLRPIT